ncbi:MAG: hypothetical protein IJ155_01865 [Prevotella sp.]|nr:hypothetical protein [Prevotella sp.]
MDQFNRDTYKKETLMQEFYHSCLGKFIILAAAVLVLFVIGIFTQPSEQVMRDEAIDNVHQCLQDNYESRGDEVDEFFLNFVRTFTKADTTLTNKEVFNAFKRFNAVEVYQHTAFGSVYLHNAYNPGGTRIGIGVFGMLISTIRYDDMVLDLGPARGKYNEKLIKDNIPELDLGENPMLKPYHYKGNPDD